LKTTQAPEKNHETTTRVNKKKAAEGKKRTGEVSRIAVTARENYQFQKKIRKTIGPSCRDWTEPRRNHMASTTRQEKDGISL